MADDIDKAQDEAAHFGNSALAATLAAARTTGPGSKHCRFCGDPIPAERRAAKPEADTCTPCQEDLERFSRRLG